MQATVKHAAPSLNEWAHFFNKLNTRRDTSQPFLTRDASAKKLMGHLELQLPVVRKYVIGKQLTLFTN